MSQQSNEVKKLAEEFESCQKILMALGDEKRQYLILEMMKIQQCNSVCVGTITKKHIFHILPFHIIFRY